MSRCAVVLLSLAFGCSGGTREAAEPASLSRCALPRTPTVIARDGNAILQRWDVPDDPMWLSTVLPDDRRYLEYRRAITAAGADHERPSSDPPTATTDEQTEIWRREALNADLAFSGEAGRVRPVRCIDAVLFAYQHARYDAIHHPTELVAMLLRKTVDGRAMLRIYFGSSDVMFPPKSVYGLDQAKLDVADGWRLAVHLHNHTIQKRDDLPALGMPAPSTSDVQLLRNVAADLDLEAVWVTNGFYTIEIPVAALAKYQTRD